MILMFLEQLRGTNLSTQDRDKFWKKSKDEIERCFGSKLCRLEKHLVILKSERVTAAISKYRETMGFDETMTPVDVIMHVILQVNLQLFMVTARPVPALHRVVDLILDRVLDTGLD